MKRIALLSALVFLFTMISCAPSLYPIYTEKDLVYDPELIGIWSEADSKETWQLIKGEEKGYTLIFTDDEGRRGEFVAHLMKIENKSFIDLFPAKLKIEENDMYKAHFLPVHTFAYVSQTAPKAIVSTLEPDWLKKYLEKHPKAIRHEKIDDDILLTAPPKELQKFVLKHLETEGAFGEPSELERKKAE